MDHATEDISSNSHKKETISGVKWSVINQFFSQVLTFVIGIILMRSLAPETFGLLALVTVFTGFVTLLSKFGLGASLIQSDSLTQTDKDTVLFASTITGVVLMTLVYFLSYFIAEFYQEPRLVEIGHWLSISFLIAPIGSVPMSMLQKDLRYKRIFITNATAVSLAAIVAVTMAYNDMGVWSLVAQQLTLAFVNAVMAWILAGYRFTFKFSKENLRKHMSFGLPFLGSKSIIYWVGSADNLIVGWFLGPTALGIYSRAFSIVTLPSRRLGLSLSTVMFPSLAKIKSDVQRVTHIFLKMNRVLLFVLVPMMLYIHTVARPFIMLVVGEEWEGAIEILEILAFVAIFKILFLLNHNTINSQGKSMEDLKVNIFSGVVTISAFLIGVQFSLRIMSLLYLAGCVLVWMAWWRINKVNLQISYRRMFSEISPFLISGLVLWGIKQYYAHWISGEDYWVFIWAFGIISSGWLILLYFLRKSLLLEVYDLFAEVILKRKTSKVHESK